MEFDFISIAKEFLVSIKKDVDKHTDEGATINVNGPESVSIFTPNHFQFAKYGRGPGKKPPLDPILKWVNKKGIIFDGTTKRGTAFVIQKSIGEKGTSNYVPNAPNALQELINENVDSFTKKLSGEVLKFQTKKVDEAYKKTIFFKNQKFKI